MVDATLPDGEIRLGGGSTIRCHLTTSEAGLPWEMGSHRIDDRLDLRHLAALGNQG